MVHTFFCLVFIFLSTIPTNAGPSSRRDTSCNDHATMQRMPIQRRHSIVPPFPLCTLRRVTWATASVYFDPKTEHAGTNCSGNFAQTGKKNSSRSLGSI